MRLEKCWFCSSTVYPGHGIQFVRNDAKIFKFCRSKCHKNFKMKRNPRKVKWTKVYRTLLGKDVTQESDLKLERKRNKLERYDRNLMRDILDSIRRNDRVESHKAERHSLKKLEANKYRREKEKQKELQQDISLISALTPLLEPSLSPPKINVKISQAQLEENLPMEESKLVLWSSFVLSYIKLRKASDSIETLK